MDEELSTLTICPRCKGRQEIQCHLGDHGWASCPDCFNGLPYAELNLGLMPGFFEVKKDNSSLMHEKCVYVTYNLNPKPTREELLRSETLKAASKHLYDVCAELHEWICESCPDVEFPDGFEDRLSDALKKAGRDNEAKS